MSRARRFRSRLASDFAGHVELRRALGRRYRSPEAVLRQLDRFLARHFPSARDLSVPILAAWFASKPTLRPESRLAYLRTVRQFCLHRRRMAPHAFVPDRVQHRFLWPDRVAPRLPFVFSRQQLRELLAAALALPASRGNPHRGRTFFTLVLVLYTTGMRTSEAVHLRVDDINFATGILLVRESKFFKTRLVPVAKDVLRLLQDHVRDLPAGPEQPVFQTSARVYSLAYVGELGCRLLRTCGFKPAEGHVGPRVHDLRRTFAVHRIARWYAAGADVQSRLPALATYMGHKNIVSTQHYATVTETIGEQAGRRFERACAPSEVR